MKVGVVGLGVVGSAIFKNFLEKKIKALGYDKYKNIGQINDILSCKFLFLCLPTSFNPVDKCYDISAIEEICQYLAKNGYQNLVIIKSTVEPETTEKLVKKYSLEICHNPEFLSTRSAYQDCDQQKHIVIGKSEGCSKKKIEDLIFFFKKFYPNAEISECSSGESELMKLCVNNFYAVKIQFFNEIYSLSEKLENVSYNKVRELILKNGWINPMHTKVPGTDGKLSYGGMCFPKDTNALREYMKRKAVLYGIIDAAIEERNFLRKD